MNEDQTVSSQKSSGKGSTKNIIIISAFLLLFIAIVAIALAKISNHFKSATTAQNPYANTTNSYITAPVVSPTGMMPNATAKDTSNTQIDKDLQDAQGNLDKLDSNVNNVDQGLNNGSQDIPQ